MITRGAKLGGGTDFNAGQLIDPGEVNTDFNTAYSGHNALETIVTALNTEVQGGLDDSNITTATIPGAKSLRFTEIASPTTPAADQLLMFASDTGGITLLAVKDSTGTTYAPGLQRYVGTTTALQANMGGTVSTQMLASATGANTTETDLASYTLPANAFATDGQRLHITASGVTAATPNTKRLRLYVGSTAVWDTGALAANTAHWFVTWQIMRTSATACYSVATGGFHGFVATCGVVSPVAVADWTSARTFKITGQNGTAAANDIVCGSFITDWYDAHV